MSEALRKLTEASLITLAVIVLSGIESSLWCVPVSGILFAGGIMMIWEEELK